MKVTEVRIRQLINEQELKAFASVTLDNGLALNDIRVIHGKRGYLNVFYPSSPYRKKSNQPLYCPINNETHRMIEAAVIAAYMEKLVAEEVGENVG